MKKRIVELLEKEGIYLCRALSLAECIINRRYLLERAGIDSGCVLLFGLPYFTKECDTLSRNISAYASVKDYHAFAKKLESRILPILGKEYPENKFALFSDHSPIDERDAGEKCGIGFRGDNGLLINDDLSSYFFIGEIITDALLECDAPIENKCLHCGRCRSACPAVSGEADRCLSLVTQKKGELSDGDEAVLLKHGSAWGCDICQEVCPFTEKAKKKGSIYTKIKYFEENVIPTLTEGIVTDMTDADFSERAFSWRGRETVLRNIRLFAKEGKECLK